MGRVDLILSLVCALWITFGLLAFFVFRKRTKFLERIAGPLFAFYGVFLTLGVLEVGLQVKGWERHPVLWQPGVHLVRTGDPHGFPGVSGPATFTVNEFGLRGPSVSPSKGIYKIITMGGSSTECFVLDDSKEWPHLLMAGLNAAQKDHPVWLANAGVAGHTAVHHLQLLRSIPLLNQADLLIFLPGVNDLQATWSFEGAATQASLELDADEFLRTRGLGKVELYPLYKRSRLYKMVKSVFGSSPEFRVHEDTNQPTWFDHRRAVRAASGHVSAPNLEIGLREYAARIREIAQECRLRGRRCLFLTQPSMWREDLTPVQQKDTSALYDDVHFNENGARIVAQALVRYLLSTAPFSSTAERATPQASSDSVSASPFRVPISHLASAQAVIEERAHKSRKKS